METTMTNGIGCVNCEYCTICGRFHFCDLHKVVVKETG